MAIRNGQRNCNRSVYLTKTLFWEEFSRPKNAGLIKKTLQFYGLWEMVEWKPDTLINQESKI